jgi:hypothetical protein
MTPRAEIAPTASGLIFHTREESISMAEQLAFWQ